MADPQNSMAADSSIPKFIRRVMPGAAEAELREATDNFRQYMNVTERIYQRITQNSSLDSHETGVRGRVDINPPL
jgi:hypothetical protein